MFISVDPYSPEFLALTPHINRYDGNKTGKNFSELEHCVTIGNTLFAFLEPDNQGFAVTLAFDKKQYNDVAELLDSVNIQYSSRQHYP